jgi:hypothetical protein
MFTIPKGVTLYFYVLHGESLPNDIGQKVDQFVLDGPGAVPHVGAPLRHPSQCHAYHLYNRRGGGYLNLKMSPKANPNYITHDEADGGVAMEDILKAIAKTTDDAHVHWSACRAVEKDSDPVEFPEDQPRRVSRSNIRVNEDTDFKKDLGQLISGGPVSFSGLPPMVPSTAPVVVHKQHGIFCKMKQFFTGNKKT